MATAPPKSSIFRTKTVQKYLQNREKSVLPRVIAPRVFVLCWIILILLIAAAIFVWLGQVPMYVAGQGVVLDQSTSANEGDQATAVVLLPAGDLASLRAGQAVQVQIGQAGPLLNRTVEAVSQRLLSPSEIYQQYGLRVTEPSLVVTVGLGPTVSGHLYAGSLVQGRIQLGSQSLLSLFPVFNALLKD